MDSYLRFTAVAVLSLVVGIPFWTLVFAPDQSPFALFTEPFVWMLLLVFVPVMLFGFWVGKRTRE